MRLGILSVADELDGDGDLFFAMTGETWLDVESRRTLIIHLMNLTPIPPELSGKSICDSCGHTRRMHSIAGCTWSDPKGNCRCSVTFMDL